MSVVECLAEDSAAASSSIAAAEEIAVLLSLADGTTVVIVGPTPAVITNTAAATSSFVGLEQFATLLNTAAASSVVTPQLDRNELLASSANTRSRLFATFNQTLTETVATVSSFPYIVTSHTLVSSAASSSTVTLQTDADVLLASTAATLSSVVYGLEELAVGAAAAVSTLPAAYRLISNTETSTGVTVSLVFASNTPQLTLESTADTSSWMSAQTDWNALLENTADVESVTWYADPDLLAWVMNTESSAMSQYNNFGFESLAQVDGQVFAAGEDGLYLLGADDDAGTAIAASMQYGFLDFGSPQTKRLDSLYFGYTTDGQLKVNVEVLESGYPPAPYTLEARTATAPRNNRVVPAKGLWGRYWRVELSNVNGAKFKVFDVNADVAVSARRI